MTQVWGTQPDAIDEAEDRDRWMDCLNRLDIKQPPGTMVTNEDDALKASSSLGYPVSGAPRSHRTPLSYAPSSCTASLLTMLIYCSA